MAPNLYEEAGGRRNVDPLLLQAVARVESGERDNAVGAPTRWGTAKGRMQFIDATAARYGVTNPHDPMQAVPAGAAYLDDLLNQHGDVTRALVAYSGGDREYPSRVAREYARLAQAQGRQQTPEDDPFAATLTAPMGGQQRPSAVDPFTATLTAPHTPIGQVDAPQTSMSGVANSIFRGMHQALDTPAQALASGADWLAGKAGFNTTFAQDAARQSAAFNDAYDADPNNKGFVPGAARLVGNALVTLPAAVGPGRLVEGAGTVAGAMAPRLAPAISALTPAASGAAQGGMVAGMTGEDIGEGAAFGGALGGAFAAGTGVANRLLKTGNPAVERAITTYGIPLRAGQVSESPYIRKLDQMVGQLPGSGIEASNVAQRTAFNRAVARTFGEEADQITPAVMQRARNRIGGVMNDIESRYPVRLDSEFRTRLEDIVQQWGPSVTEPEWQVIRKQIDGVLRNVGPDRTITGTTYGNLLGNKSPLTAAANNPNSSIAQAAGEIKEALQEALQRSLPTDAARKYAEARYQYKNMMTIAPLVNRGIPGDISPLLLQGVANRSFKQNAFRGAGDLGELGDIGQQFLRPPRDSGTPMGNAINKTLYGGVTEGLKTMAGVTGGRLAARALQANPIAGMSISPAEISAALLLRNRLLANAPQGER